MFMLAAAAAALAAPGAAQTGRPAAGAPAARPQPEAPPIPRAVFLSNMDSEFRRMDADKNGILTRKEIEDSQRAAAVLQAQIRNRQLFAALDADKNGMLSPGEFARLAQTVPQPNASPMIQRFDTNSDRAISLVEYRAGTLANFDKLDTDKDGVVTPAEMRAGGIGAR